jgi:hypothetical protein
MDRGSLVIIGLAVACLAGFAFEARSGQPVHWWNWVISGLLIVNTTVSSLPALQNRPMVRLAISRISLAVSLVVLVAIVAHMQG